MKVDEKMFKIFANLKLSTEKALEFNYSSISKAERLVSSVGIAGGDSNDDNDYVPS